MEPFESERLILGCMRLNKLSQKEADNYLNYAIDRGIKFFDHSDIYGSGECEKIFGRFLNNNPTVRANIILQNKTSIVPGIMYDCSYSHIINAVNKELKDLNTDHLDILLLHRPDALLEETEVDKAFNKLKASGKVLNFGVSNFPSLQIELLQRGVEEKIKFNQMQFGPAKAEMVTDSLQANMLQSRANCFSDTFDYCRLNNIRIQTWSPLQYGNIEGSIFNNPEYENLNKKLEELGEKYSVDKSAIAVAFNLRHPANMQVIVGTMNKKHLDYVVQALDIKLTRKEWYEIMLSAGYPLP